MGKQEKSYSLVCLAQKIEKNVPIIFINNDGEHTRKTEDGVSSLQLFSCNRKADSKIPVQASKSRGNVVIELKETGILILLIYGHSTCEVSK